MIKKILKLMLKLFLIENKVSTDEEIYKVLSDKIKEINKIMPKYKAIRGMIISEEPLIKTTTNKIKRQANLDIIENKNVK